MKSVNVELIVVIAGVANLLADTIHVEEFRTNELAVAAGGGRYSAYFTSDIELPDFRYMPAPLAALFVELTTGQETNEIHAAVWQERSAFFGACRQNSASGGGRFTRFTTTKLLFQNKRFASFRINYQHFCGYPCGAANEGETKNVTFDCKLGKILVADDIVSKENNRKLLNLIRFNLYRQFKDKGDEFKKFAEPETRTDAQIVEDVSWARKGDTGVPWVSDNFCLTAEGMEWSFMPCEIVSPSYGTITVKVSWRDLNEIVINDFRISEPCKSGDKP